MVTLAVVTNTNEVPSELAILLKTNCARCHNKETAKGGLNLAELLFDLQHSEVRSRWIQIYDRVEKQEMPPKTGSLSRPERDRLMSLLQQFRVHVDAFASSMGTITGLNTA
ncbi:MAG TPA: hypothetical protein DCE55_17050 [Planctomycetaceae bacterium]|nr:hypothetical protein [Planctomycetaceae bacterium]